MYKAYIPPKPGALKGVIRLLNGALAFIPFDLDNTDYQRFKSDLAKGVELKDPDDNVMTPEQVTEFLESLP